MTVTPKDAVDAANGLFGRHPGYRALHAKGTLLKGTFTADTERETRGDVLVFDATRVTDGIELSDDPVLRFRHDAHSESIARRMTADGQVDRR